MSKKKLYLQVSFEQGMVDTVVSDYDYQDGDMRWQSPQSRSAVFIKNYDPSLVKGALTKRGGYGLLRTTQRFTNGDMGLIDFRTQQGLGQSPPVKGLPLLYNQTEVIEVDLSRFTTLCDIEANPTLQLGTGQIDPFTVCGAMAVPYNKPISQNVLVYFLRHVIESSPDEERTRIVHFGTHVTTQFPIWRNSHINGISPYNQSIRISPQPSAFPGWDVRGTFTDAARHGGTIVFTTDVAIETYPWAHQVYTGTTFTWAANPWTDEMYPCYVWTYWDLRRKRDKRKFWQIINDGSNTVTFLSDLNNNYTLDDKYSQFKVLLPSLKPTRDTTFVSWRTYIQRVNNAGLGSAVIQNGDVSSTGEMQYAAALQTPFVDAQNLLTTEPVVSAIEVSIIEARGRQFQTAPITYVNENNPFTDKLTATREYVWLNNYNNYIRTLEIPKNYEIQAVDHNYWKLWRFGAVENISIVNGVLMYGTSQKQASVICHPLTQNNTGDDLTIKNGKTPPDEKSIENESFYWTVGVSLPNYLQDNCPRPWLKGEQIPLLLTATIRGLEVIISTHTHTVSTNDYLPYPSLWFPNKFWYHMTFQGGSFNGYNSSSKTYDEQQLSLLPGLPDLAHAGPPPYKDQVTEQYYLALDNQIRFNGKKVVVASVRGYALARSGTFVAGSGNLVKYRLYESYKAYCIEPFNPTSNAPYVATDDTSAIGYPLPFDDTYGRIFSRPVATSKNIFNAPEYAYDDEVCGYRMEHTNPKLIMFTIKLKKSRLNEIIEQNIESLNLYCAQPSDISAFNSVGLHSLQSPTTGIYMLPDTPDENDVGKYRLVKRFVLDGDGSPFNNFRTSDDNQYWKDFYTGSPTATNSWVEKGPNSTTGFLIATGQHKTEVSGSNASSLLTPDFILWDYPVSTPLSLNSSGNYWQGRGAKLVTNIKGRTFIGGCLDRYGEEEQALIRYSDVQSGVISLDVFSEENYLKVGGLPHVAFTEYREHLWVFSRSECHRIQMPDVVDVTSWEYLDKIPGQGTFSQKTVITTPHGVIWGNESGVWLSDGRMPENLAQQVLTFYKRMSTNNPTYYATKIDLPQFPFDENSINPYMEVAYNEFANELVISSPIAKFVGVTDYQPEDHQQLSEEYRLVYSFETKLWHVQHADLTPFGNYLNEFDSEGKVTF
jgi:hypothetical protein